MKDATRMAIEFDLRIGAFGRAGILRAGAAVET